MTTADIDARDRAMVLRAYRSAQPQAQFDAAFECFVSRHPGVRIEVARRMVAWIIATDGEKSLAPPLIL